MSAVFRFAPSPNGRLHLGHAYSALLNADLAARYGGRLLVRIEDIDPTRCRPDLEAAMLADLAWLGLHWEVPVRRQSDELPVYAAALARLRARDLVYPCVCSRGDIARVVAGRGGAPPRDPDGALLYPGTCRERPRPEIDALIGAGLPHAWRLDMARARAAAGGPLLVRSFALDGGETERIADPARWGDAVIGRKDVATSYHLSVVVDDAAQGVTHVVRGADLAPATDLHGLLQVLLDLPRPRYHHHALLLDADGRKLSKSIGSTSLADLRADGLDAATLRTHLGFGHDPPA